MPRKRMLEPDIWEDPKIIRLSIGARLTFIGLITQANDYGKLRGEAWSVKSKIFPADKDITEETVEEFLNELEKVGLIFRYQNNGEIYIKLRSWEKHQKVAHPSQDVFPDPPESLVKASRKSHESLTLKLSKDKLSKEKRREDNINNKALTRKNSSQEPSQSKNITFSFEEREWKNITEKDKEEWAKAFPACNIDYELRRMKEWILANPKRGKKKNYRRFIYNWLSKTQDRGGSKFIPSQEMVQTGQEILKEVRGKSREPP